MTLTEKTGIISQCYATHLRNGLDHDAAVAHIQSGLGLSRDAIHYAIRPLIEAASLSQQLSR